MWWWLKAGVAGEMKQADQTMHWRTMGNTGWTEARHWEKLGWVSRSKKTNKKNNTKALQSLQSKQSSNCIQSLVWDNLVVSWPGLIGAIADETQAHLVAETCTTTFKLVAPRLANGLWHDYLWWFGAYEKRCSETEILNKQCYVIFSFEFFIYHPYSGHLHDTCTVCTADVLRLDY